jgi:pimeloyl-ACP methyl ester carboxylesterase
VALAYDRLGQGPPLLLLHPLGADRRAWDPILDQVAQHREVLAVDLPGFGGTPPLPETPTPRALAETVAVFLESIGVARPHVAGNSLGGWVALELALAGHVRSATAIAPAGLWARPLTPKRGIARNLTRALLPALDRVASSGHGRRLLLARSVARPERVPAGPAAHLVRSYITAPGFTAVNDAMRAGRFDGLERIRVPVTLAWSEHDGLIRPPAWLPPTVASRVLEGCGHIPMWDGPAQVASLLLGGSEG